VLGLCDCELRGRTELAAAGIKKSAPAQWLEPYACWQEFEAWRLAAEYGRFIFKKIPGCYK